MEQTCSVFPPSAKLGRSSHEHGRHQKLKNAQNRPRYMHQDFRMHQNLALFFSKKNGRGGVETVEITAGQDISIKPPRRPRTAQDGQSAFKEPRRCAQDALRTAEDTSSCNVDEVWLERIGHGGDSWMGVVRPVLTVTFRLLRADVMFSSHLALSISLFIPRPARSILGASCSRPYNCGPCEFLRSTF